MLAFEFLRVREMIAQLLEVAREAVGFATRMESERGEARAVAHEDVGLVLHLEAVEEPALGAAALAFRVKFDGLFKTARRDLALPRVVGVKLRDRPREIRIEHGDRAEEPHAQRRLLQIAPRDHRRDLAAPLDEHLLRRGERAEHDIEARGFVERFLLAKLSCAFAERAVREIARTHPARHQPGAPHAEHAQISRPHQLRAERHRLIFIQRRQRLREVHGGQAPRERAAQARDALRFTDGSVRGAGHWIGVIVPVQCSAANGTLVL